MVITRLTSLAGVGLAAALFSAAPVAVAHADEFGFVADLEEEGVHYASINDLLGLGNLACRQLGEGIGIQQITNNLIDAEAQLPPPRLDGGPGYSTPRLRAISIINRAADYLCPDQRYRIDQYLAG